MWAANDETKLQINRIEEIAGKVRKENNDIRLSTSFSTFF